MAGRAEVEALNREAIGLILMKVAIFTLGALNSFSIQILTWDTRCKKRKKVNVKGQL
jgi:hypothetical protein